MCYAPLRMMPNMKLFQENTKERIAAVTIPGAEMGRMIFKKLLNRVLPSTAADSSSSLGSDSKKGTMIQIMKGRETTMWARMSPKWVSIMPRKVKIANHGTRKRYGRYHTYYQEEQRSSLHAETCNAIRSRQCQN